MTTRHSTVTFKLLLYHNSESGDWWLGNWVSSFWKWQVGSKKVEALRPEAMNPPSPSSLLTDWSVHNMQVPVCCCPGLCLLADLTTPLQRLTPWQLSVKQWQPWNTWRRDLMSRYQVFKKSRQFSAIWNLEAWQRLLCAWITSRTLQCWWSTRIPGLLSMFKKIKATKACFRKQTLWKYLRKKKIRLSNLPYLLALFFSWVVSASVLELTDWLSEFLLLSPNFLSLFKRLSVSLSPYLLLITGAGAGSPTLDLKAPVPRLKKKQHRLHKQHTHCRQPGCWEHLSTWGQQVRWTDEV